MSDDDERIVSACPECDWARLVRGGTGMNSRRDATWACERCGWQGEDAVRRPAKINIPPGLSAQGKALAAADPEDLGLSPADERGQHGGDA